MGVVFHGNYLTWFEIGRTELVRRFGMPYREIEAKGLLLPVVELECKYAAPARYDDRVIVCTSIAEFSPVRIAFRSQVRRIGEKEEVIAIWRADEPPGELLVYGGTRHVWVSAEWRPSRLDKGIPELYELLKSVASGEYEEGEGRPDA
jgi:acyl-CoA thioester hydrolase